MMKRLIGSLLLCAIAGALTPSAKAHSMKSHFTKSHARRARSAKKAARKDRLTVAATYAAQRSNNVPGKDFWLQGGAAELDATLAKGFGFDVDLDALHTSYIKSSGAGLDLVSATFGPRYRWTLPVQLDEHDVTLFGSALFGEVHGFHSVFPFTTASQPSATAFALKIGGGVDVSLSRCVSLRAIQANWIHTQLPNGTNDQQNSFEIGAGVVLHLR